MFFWKMNNWGIETVIYISFFTCAFILRYARMPEELLPSVIVSLRAWMMEDLANKHIGLLVGLVWLLSCKYSIFSVLYILSHVQGIALSCLEAALSRSPSSVNVLKVLEEDISKGSSFIWNENLFLMNLKPQLQWCRKALSCSILLLVLATCYYILILFFRRSHNSLLKVFFVF